jgi:hypothetical protein
MCFGSDTERTFQGECRTTDDVRLLFERYRARARDAAEDVEPVEPMESPEQDEPRIEPVLAGR